MKVIANTDPAKLPNQSQDQPEFDKAFSEMIAQYPQMAAEMNGLRDEVEQMFAMMSATAAGGAYCFPFIFDSSTVNADPGVGKLRFNVANQSAAGVIYIDHQIVGGVNIDSIYAILAAVTSAVKGSIRIVKQTDPSRWVLYDVTGAVPGTGFRGLPVIYRSGSGGNPFANGDALLVFIERNGDKGEDAVGASQLLAAVTVSSPVAQIDFLSLFTSAYDRYTIEIQGVTPATASRLALRMASGGAADANPIYGFSTSSFISLGGTQTNIPLYDDNSDLFTFTIEVRNANSPAVKSIGVRGMFNQTVSPAGIKSLFGEGAYRGNSAVSGFRLFMTTGANITGGTVRVYGHKNVI